MFFAGLAKGINTSLTTARAEEAALAEKEADRENRVLSHLATSDDPEIASMALGGLMDQAAGRRPAKGLRGWLGAMEGNPAMPRIRDLMSAGKQVTTTEGGPTRMPEGASAAMPAGSAVQPGGPPMSLSAVHNALPQDPGYQRTSTVPRTLFKSPAEKARELEEAQMGGKLSAFRTGLREAQTPQEELMVMGAAGIRPQAGEYLGNIQENGQWFRQEGRLDPTTGTYAIQKIPIAAPTSLQVKPTLQVLATPDGSPHLFRIMPDGTRTDLGAKPVRNGIVTYTDPDTQMIMSVPAPATFQRPAAGSSAVATAPPPGPVAAPTSAPPAAAATAPSPAAPAGQTGGAATPPPTATTAPKPAGINRGRGALKPVEGAILGPDGMPQMITANWDGGTGYFAPGTTQRLEGFIPGKEGAEVLKTIADTKAIESTLDRAMEAIDKLGYADDDDPNTTAKMVDLYRSGKAGEDPLVPAFTALNSFVTIQGSGQFIRSTRAFQFVQQIQEHLPKLPHTREAAANQLTGGLYGPTNPLARVAMGTSWDSPKLMREKMLQAKTNLQQIRLAVTEAAGKVPGHEAGGQATAPPPGPAAPMQRARDPQGTIHEASAGTPLPAGWTLER